MAMVSRPLDEHIAEEYTGIDAELGRLRGHPDPEAEDYRAALDAVTVRALALNVLVTGLQGKLVSPNGHLLCQDALRIHVRESMNRVRRAWAMRASDAGTMPSGPDGYD
jgi:hypothetical protein